MGIHTTQIILSVFLIVNTITIQNPIQTCSEKLLQVCDCFYYPMYTVRCSHKFLNNYPDVSKVQNVIEKLDVSNNALTKFPPKLINFFALEILDLSFNRIEFLSPNVLLPNNLRHLILSYNNISDWHKLIPNSFFESAQNLETLSLAGNPLGTFNDNDDQLLLISGSLKKLDLSNCQIHKIIGSQMLSGLMNLEHLSLSLNPLTSLPDLQAIKLMTLDLSKCNLTRLRSNTFLQMPVLSYLNFTENYRLSLKNRNEQYVESVSLRKIDLTNCYMNAIELNGFPNLTSVNLHGNFITELSYQTFKDNVLIENLDLSSNAINRISVTAFQHLQRLRNIDLSENLIRHIERETFDFNKQLTSINLSRNNIDRFCQFSSPSLTFLNMSRCEITTIEEDALAQLVELIELDLSYNLFSDLPDKFQSPFLQILDMKRCRLSKIENHTFSNLPELSRLNLAGNRLTITLQKSFFANNAFLHEIWLGDNLWHCSCDKKSHEFYQFIFDRPQKIKDPSQFLCYSETGNPYGENWDTLCSNQWDNIPRRVTAFERVWTIIMAIVFVIALIYSLICGVKWWTQYQKETREEHQRQENLETTRELMHHNQRVLEQEAQLNAPDPRETHPPCYADAILMPRPASSFASLKQNYASNDSINSIRRATKRSNSDEFLNSNTTNKNRRIILAARSRKNQIEKWIKNTSANSTASISGFVKNKPMEGSESSHNSFKVINQFETDNDYSPYAKRKPQKECQSTVKIQSSSESLNEPIYANGYIVAQQKITAETSFSTSSTSSFDSDEYILDLCHSRNSSPKQSDV